LSFGYTLVIHRPISKFTQRW